MADTMYPAPRVYHVGARKQTLFVDGTQEMFYKIEHPLFAIVNNILGNSSAQLRIMYMYIGTQGDGSFAMPQKEITKRTGLSQQSYDAALKALKKRGWIEHEPYKYIKVNFDKIYEHGRQFFNV